MATYFRINIPKCFVSRLYSFVSLHKHKLKELNKQAIRKLFFILSSKRKKLVVFMFHLYFNHFTKA